MIRLTSHSLAFRAKPAFSMQAGADPATGAGRLAHPAPAPLHRTPAAPPASTETGNHRDRPAMAPREEQVCPDPPGLGIDDWLLLAAAIEERLRQAVCRRLPAVPGSHRHDLQAARMQATILECAQALGQLRAIASEARGWRRSEP